MDTTALDFNTLALLVAILGSTVGSTLTLVTLIVRQSNRHEDSIKALDTKFTGKIDALDTKFTDKIDALDTKFTDKIDALDTKFTDKIDALDTKFTDKIDALDTKFTGKIDALQDGVTDGRERLARIEGYLMAPGGFKVRGLDPPGPGESSPDDPDQRAAG